MYQYLKALHEGEEGCQKLPFGFARVGKPLYELPAKAVVVCAADQIQLGCVAGKASGFYIEKSRSLRGPMRSRGYVSGKSTGCLMVIMCNHSFLEGIGYELRSVPDIPYGLVYTKKSGNASV